MGSLVRACLRVSVAVVVCAVLAGLALASCKQGGTGITEEQAKKFEAGPPKEMPAEAKAMMEKMAKEGAGAPKGKAGPPPTGG